MSLLLAALIASACPTVAQPDTQAEAVRTAMEMADKAVTCGLPDNPCPTSSPLSVLPTRATVAQARAKAEQAFVAWGACVHTSLDFVAGRKARSPTVMARIISETCQPDYETWLSKQRTWRAIAGLPRLSERAEWSDYNAMRASLQKDLASSR